MSQSGSSAGYSLQRQTEEEDLRRGRTCHVSRDDKRIRCFSDSILEPLLLDHLRRRISTLCDLFRSRQTSDADCTTMPDAASRKANKTPNAVILRRWEVSNFRKREPIGTRSPDIVMKTLEVRYRPCHLSCAVELRLERRVSDVPRSENLVHLFCNSEVVQLVVP